MKTRVQKWGNSLAVRIPKSFAIEAGLEEDIAVDVSISEGKLVLTPVAEPAFSLEELLSQVTDENLHAAWDTGSETGNEAW